MLIKLISNNIKTKNLFVKKSNIVFSFTKKPNEFHHVTKRHFSIKLGNFKKEVCVLDSNKNDFNYINPSDFAKEFLEYRNKKDYKVEKEKLIFPKFKSMDFPFVLYESSGKPFYFFIYFIAFLVILQYLISFINNKIKKKFDPFYRMKYFILYSIGVIILGYFVKNHFKVIKKITVLNFNNSGINLEIKLLFGKTIKDNISNLHIDQVKTSKLFERGLGVIRIRDNPHYFIFSGSSINGKTLFMNLVRGKNFILK